MYLFSLSYWKILVSKQAFTVTTYDFTQLLDNDIHYAVPNCKKKTVYGYYQIVGSAKN